MKVLYYDCFAGISGDMNLGALIDLGVDKDYLIGEIGKLGLQDKYEIKVSRAIRKGIEGTKVDVLLKEEHHHEHNDLKHEHIHSEKHVHSHEQDNDHNHCDKHNHEHVHNDEIHHSHVHNHQHVHEHEKHEHSHGHVHHEHRGLSEIKNIINNSTLSEAIKKNSIEIFKKIAISEAKIHGKDIEEIHFHEVGAIDAIVDIVGACIAIEYLNVDKMLHSKIEVGSGFVKCAHGIMPVPAPATLDILRGRNISIGKVAYEATTPTGAAIITALGIQGDEKISINVNKIGYGVGNKDQNIPNVLRVMLADVF